MNYKELVLIVFLAAAIGYAILQIIKGNTGGCNGNCASCRKNCKSRK